VGLPLKRICERRAWAAWAEGREHTIEFLVHALNLESKLFHSNGLAIELFLDATNVQLEHMHPIPTPFLAANSYLRFYQTQRPCCG
jgi:hypothetical protein